MVLGSRLRSSSFPTSPQGGLPRLPSKSIGPRQGVMSQEMWLLPFGGRSKKLMGTPPPSTLQGPGRFPKPWGLLSLSQLKAHPSPSQHQAYQYVLLTISTLSGTLASRKLLKGEAVPLPSHPHSQNRSQNTEAAPHTTGPMGLKGQMFSEHQPVPGIL